MASVPRRAARKAVEHSSAATAPAGKKTHEAGWRLMSTCRQAQPRPTAAEIRSACSTLRASSPLGKVRLIDRELGLRGKYDRRDRQAERSAASARANGVIPDLALISVLSYASCAHTLSERDMSTCRSGSRDWMVRLAANRPVRRGCARTSGCRAWPLRILPLASSVPIGTPTPRSASDHPAMPREYI
jgi:hypothetical protein